MPAKPSAIRGLGHGHRYRRRHAAQVVNMRQKRRAGLAHSHQAGHGTRRRGEHTVADPAGSRDDRAQSQTRIQHGIIHLRDHVGHSLICDRSERAAGGDQRPPVSPGNQIGRVRLGPRRRIGEREDDRPLRMRRHFLDDRFRESCPRRSTRRSAWSASPGAPLRPGLRRFHSPSCFQPLLSAAGRA